MDPNPYESPHSPEPDRKPSAARRTIGTAAIVLLTPIAMLIAIKASCTACDAVLNTNLFGDDYGLMFLVGWTIVLVPPAAVLCGMILWARLARQEEEADQRRNDG